MNITQKITPHLWFAHEAEEAVAFYTSIFKDSKIGHISHYGEAGHEIHGMEAGTVLTIDFELEGMQFMALNGGPAFRFNEAISLIVNCETQEEVDYYWEKLGEGGDPEAQQCGWLKDKYGLSWQITPVGAVEMLNDPDRTTSERVMEAILKMKKLDMAEIKAAFDGGD
jgi:predicted 3-demethylubiquinone-9 3-methyltransferase (glyoxalase superfamily)